MKGAEMYEIGGGYELSFVFFLFVCLCALPLFEGKNKNERKR